MSQAPVQSGLVRVTVASGTRRVDLVLPGAVPVAELVPELARSVGLLDPATVYGGYRLVTAEGRELSTDAGLIIQGVEDGGLITVTAGVDERPPRVYDDVVEAMTDVVEEDLQPWAPGAGRRTALWAAGLVFAAHMAGAWATGRRRVTGILFFAWLGLLAVTGYLLLYAGDDGAWGLVSPTHWIAGLALPMAYAAHRWLRRG